MIAVRLQGADEAPPDLVITGATSHVGDGKVIEDSVVVVRGGKISYAGPRAGAEIPPGARLIDGRGKHLTPGFVDLYSRLSLDESELRDFGATESRSTTDALDLFDEAWVAARREGITTVAVSAGTSLGAAGLGAILKLRAPGPGEVRGLPDLLLVSESHFTAGLGVSGERSTSAERLEQYHRLRGLFLAAKDYAKTWDTHWKAVEKHNDELKKAEPRPAEPPKPEAQPPKSDSRPKPPRAPAVDVGREALLRTLDGKLPVLIEAHRRDDIEYALLLKKEFGLRLVILGATQGHLLADRLAEAGAPVAVEPVLLDRWALELHGHRESNAAILHSARVPVAIASSGRRGLGSRHLRLQAIAAVRGGLPREDALRAITSVPARSLGIEARVGTLEAGKDADLVLLSGDPLDALSLVEGVVVEGILFESSRRGPPLAFMPVLDPNAPGTLTNPPRSEPFSAGAPSAPRNGPRASATVLRGARVVTPAAGGVRIIDRGVVVLSDGKVESVGSPGEVPIPVDDPTLVDLDGKWILPGFIDAHSYAGILGETDDVALAVSEDLRVLDAFDPWDPDLPLLLERGTTAIALAPGAANVVGGRISLLKVVPGVARMRIVHAVAGLKASLTPAFALPREPTAPSGASRLFEEWVKSASRRAQPVVVAVASRSLAERAARVLAEAGALPVLLDGGSLGADSWARLRPTCPVILGPYGLDDPWSRLRAPAEVHAAGAPIAFATSGTRRDLLTTAVLAIRAGLPRDEALLALTARPAALYGAAGRLGVIAPGADADLVIWSDDPFSLRGRVEAVYIDGERVMPSASTPPPSREPEDRRRPEAAAAPIDGRQVAGGFHAE